MEDVSEKPIWLVSSLMLFAGCYKVRLTAGRPWGSGLELAIIGRLRALAGYAVGALLRVPVTA